jgi:hypothetical protein
MDIDMDIDLLRSRHSKLRIQHNKRRREEEDYVCPEGFLKLNMVLLKPNQYLLVTLCVCGTWQTNSKFGGGSALMIRSFTINSTIAEKCPEKFKDLSIVLPKMANIVSMDQQLALDLTNHLWFLGIETDFEGLSRNYDITGRNSGATTAFEFSWYLDGRNGSMKNK